MGGEDDLSNLSNQPIILNCIAEEDAFNYELAYWPSTEEIGEKVLRHLIQEEKDDTEKSIELVDMFTKVARKEYEIESSSFKKCRKRLEKAVGVITDQVEKLGLVCLVERDFYFSKDEETFYANPALFTVSFSQLSPHLYHQECMLYC